MTISILRRSTSDRGKRLQIETNAPVAPLEFDDDFDHDDGLPASLHRMLSVLSDGIAVVDGHGLIRHANEHLVALTGFSSETLNGQPVAFLVPAWDRDAGPPSPCDAKMSGVLSEAVDLRLNLRCRNGNNLEALAALSPFVFEGEPWVVILVRDMRTIRAAEQHRVATELRFRLAFEGNMAPMAVADLDDRITSVNDAFCRMVGYSKEELLGHDAKLFTYPDDVGISEESHRRAIAGETEQARYIKRYVRSDGKVIFVEVSRSAARDTSGELLYFVFSERDITEERTLSAQLTHQALHDPLTALANRALFMDRLS